MLDYKLLEALAAVVQEGGFEKAAARLHITQSAVSQRVKLLEDQAGQVLMVRTSPPRATPAGRQMIKHYLQVNRLEEDLKESLDLTGQDVFTTLALGINGDSLSTWFLPAVRDFLIRERLLLDLRGDDQDETHKMLRDGEVIGCISVQDRPMQGCLMEYLGRMDYRLIASPEYAAKWFPEGMNLESASKAPFFIFNRKDHLHYKMFPLALGEVPTPLPAHYLPSSEQFVSFIEAGLGYGMLPDQQSKELLEAGLLVDLAPSHIVPVHLYWHCWNLSSALLERFTRHLVRKARRILQQGE
ncbi:transcriptional regulator, ArgP, LysR family [Desulfatibacillum aliphaticivorans]|uniref:Transcriptional regulator, ArgP, LysR family n=1 Tax=Desulfatibacillum aliphaticivorans TaxID=218208 RepID=B8FDR1_DESAL|nr:LysR family transcriptional regulator ArgP [Desulfatibacillum aliphaticivorans]ACL06692.1 transcriptional regulator, ArgP, LysR family [Desulfatibacillum aliphaticivorans]